MHLKVLGYMELEDGDGRPVVSVLKRPKLAAFLGVLAVGDTAVRSRDRLMAMFWPDADAARASHSLNQLVYQLRKALGDVVERRGDQLLVDPDLLRCDAIRFEASIESEDFETAVSLYQGEFLEGLYVSDSPDFERWVDAQRSRLSRAAAQASWGLAERYAAESRFLEASTMARRAAECTPGDEAALRRLLGFLDAIGDRAGAVSAYEDFARHLRVEFGVEPSPETAALLERIRARDEAITELPVRRPEVGAGGVTEEAHTPPRAPAPSRPAPPSTPATRRLRWWFAASAAVLLLSVGRFILMPGETRAGSRTTVVGVLAMEGGEDAASVAPVRDLIAELAATSRFEVVSDTTGAPVDVVVGVIPYEQAEGRWVEARLIDPSTGFVRSVRSFPVEDGAEPLARFVRQRAGVIQRTRALEQEGADATQLDALRRVDMMIVSAIDLRNRRQLREGWALLAAADTALSSLEADAPRWIEPPLRRGRLANERALTLSYVEDWDPDILDFTIETSVYEALYDEAARHADRVVALDAASPLGYELRGIVSFNRWRLALYQDFDASRRATDDLTRAVAIDPYLPDAWLSLRHLREYSGDAGGARAALEQAVQADPYLERDASIRRGLLYMAGVGRDSDWALDACSAGRRDFPEDDIFAECDLFLEAWLGDSPDMIRAERYFDEVTEGAAPDDDRLPLRMGYLAAAAARAGEPARARELLAEISTLEPEFEMLATALQVVRVHALLGEDSVATDSLTAILERDPRIAQSIHVDPRFEPLHGYPAFESLVASIREESPAVSGN